MKLKIFSVLFFTILLIGITTASAPYPSINGSLMGNDLGYFFVYIDSITGGAASFFMVLSFFCITLIGSMLYSFRFSGRIKPELNFAAASFSTFGFTVILSGIANFLNPIYVLASVGLCILSAIWIFLSNPNESY